MNTKMKPLNIALGASGTVEQLLLLRHALNEEPDVNVNVYGFYDLQLTERPTGGWADLVGNRAMSYYVEPYFAADIYAPSSRLEVIQLGVIGHVPMLMERLTLWSKVEKIRRKIEEVGLPQEKATEFGRARDFKAMEFGDVGRFQAICAQCAGQRLPLAPSVELMVESTQARKAAFVVVEMPMPAAHRKVYYGTPAWHAYERYIRELLAEKKCLFINASDWVNDQHFSDDFHCGPEGAIDFTRRLAVELKPALRPHAL